MAARGMISLQVCRMFYTDCQIIERRSSEEGILLALGGALPRQRARPAGGRRRTASQSEDTSMVRLDAGAYRS
jgi:hypothetical protein